MHELKGEYPNRLFQAFSGQEENRSKYHYLIIGLKLSIAEIILIGPLKRIWSRELLSIENPFKC